jgi:hypothetical protein
MSLIEMPRQKQMEITPMGRKDDFLFRPAAVPSDQSGILLSVTRKEAGWETIDFSVRRLAQGDVWEDSTGNHETAIVARRQSHHRLGKVAINQQARNVFAIPLCDLSPAEILVVRANPIELAESRIPSELKLAPHLFTLRPRLRTGAAAI